MLKFPREKEIVFLSNEKVKLCVPVDEHIPYILRWLNNQEVLRFLGRYCPLTPKQEKKWAGKSNDEHNMNLMIHTAEGEPIGSMGLHRISYKDGTATTGAYIGEPSYWGKGYGTVAKMSLLEHAFNTLNLRAVASSVIEHNKRSRRYNEKCGYREIGRLPGWNFKDGSYYDEVLMVVTRADFLKLLAKIESTT